MSVAKAVGMETKLDVWNAALTTGGSSYMDVGHASIDKEKLLWNETMIEIEKIKVLY